MAILRTMSLFFVCFALLAGNVANAAMLCCMTDAEQPKAEMQMDGGMDMPCHKAAKSDSQDTASCDGCDCQHCVKISALSQHQSAEDFAVSGITVFTTQSIYSRQPEGVFQPPKQLS